MKTLLLFICLFGFLLFTSGGSTSQYKRTLRKIAHRIATNATWRAEFEQQKSYQSEPWRIVFDCDVIAKSPAVPTSVHKLRPGDIKVVASMGDSITAGNGVDAGNAIEVLRELRGESWSIGGDKTLDEGVLTLTNVLRKYNPSLRGYSKGYGDEYSENAWFNVAVPGAKAADLPAEADMLIERMKADTRIDWQNDWKIITLLIGGNDLCDYCKDRDVHSPTSVGAALQRAVDKLHAVVPRAFVNLVPMADIGPVPKIKTGWFCRAIHSALCRCILTAEGAKEVGQIQDRYYDEMYRLATSGRYDTRDDFTVVVQPFMKDQDFARHEDGSYDQSYIAPDCFHPNRKCHQGLSLLLWNSIFTPVGSKFVSTPNDELLKLKYTCPTEVSPYIFTGKNSN